MFFFKAQPVSVKKNYFCEKKHTLMFLNVTRFLHRTNRPTYSC